MRLFFLTIFFLMSLVAQDMPEKVVVAYNEDHPPLKFQNQKGEADGIIIDIWKLWSKKTGVEVVFKKGTLLKTIEMVKNGEADINAGLFYTKKRDESLDYSKKSFYKIDYHVFTHNTLNVVKDINESKAYIYGICDDYTKVYMQKNFPGIFVRAYKDYPSIYNAALKKREINTFISPKITYDYYLLKNDLENRFGFSAKNSVFRENYLAAVKQGNTKLLKLINHGFSKINSSEVAKIERRWIKAPIKNKLDKNRETYIISCDVDHAPFSYMNMRGEAAGVFIDVWKEWAKNQNVNVKFLFQNTEKESLEVVQSGLADFHSGTYLSSDLFISSDPFYSVNSKLYYLASKKIGKNLADKKIGILTDNYKKILTKLYPKTQFIKINSKTSIFNKLIKNEIDGFIAVESFIDDMLLKAGYKDIVSKSNNFSWPTKVHAVASKENKNILSKINNGLKKITPEIFLEIEKKWLLKPNAGYYHKQYGNNFYTKDEKSWIQNHPLVKVAIMNYWTSDDKGNSIHTDFLQLLNKYGDINFIPVRFDRWSDGYEEVLKGDNIFGILNLSWNKEREEKYFRYTTPYNFEPNHLLVRSYNNTINSLKDIGNKTIYVKKNSITKTIVKENATNAKIIELKDNEEVLEKLSTSKEADAAVIFKVEDKELKKLKLKIAQKIYDKYSDQHLGINKKYPFLQSIINKTIKRIPKEELNKIQNKSYKKSKSDLIYLSPEEKEWIGKKGVLKVSNELDWPPFDFVQDNKPSGISIDYLNLIAKKAGLELEYVNGYTWSELVELFKKGELDILHSLYKTPERQKFAKFTNSYYIDHPALIVKRGSSIKEIDDIKGKKVVYIKGYATSEYIKSKYKDLVTLYEVKNTKEALKALSFGKADAYFESLGPVSYAILENNLPNLKTLEVTLKDPKLSGKLYFATQKDAIVLNNILKKGIKSITGQERNEIKNRWILSGEVVDKIQKPSSDQAGKQIKIKDILPIKEIIIALIFFILFFYLLWKYKLSKSDHIALQGTIYILVAVFLVVTFLITIITMKNLETSTRFTLNNSLKSSLMSSHKTIKLWIKGNFKKMDIVVDNNEKILSLKRNMEKDYTKYKELEQYLRLFSKSFSDSVYYLFTTDFEILDTNRKDFKGYAITQAIKRKILRSEEKTHWIMFPFEEKIKNKKSLMQYILFIRPVYNEMKEIEAYFVMEVDPSKEFSSILKFGMMGNTGEIYCFNDQLQMISKSRFIKELIENKLIKEDQNAILNIYIKDFKNNPTFMAKSALKKENGVNTDGYLNYRNKSVLGAWLWDEELNIGFAAEIDEIEAMGDFDTIRNTILFGVFTITGFTLFLTILIVWISKRSRESLQKANESLEIKVHDRTKKLEKIKNDIEGILANIMLPILITSKEERKIVYANKYAQKQYEKSLDEIVGSNIDDIYSIKGQSNHILKALNENGFVENMEEVFKTATGKEFNALLSVTPIVYKDEECYIGMVADITKQKNMENEIRHIHNQTKDSIEYAALIQHAIVPDNNNFRKYFDEYFAIWHPKDIVGGDIYLFEELRDESECLLICIDCTGHGVPGAFITMLVKAIERQIAAVIASDPDMEINTAWILNYFNKTMKKLLRQETSDSISNAGFDGGVIYFNKKDMVLKFSGAETPLFYIDENKELQMIKGDRQSIGYKSSDTSFEFKEHKIDVKKGMKFYITTDGYLDQNGGKKGFCLGKRRFKEIISEYHEESFADQQEVFLETLHEYQGTEERNDDITLIGIKI